MKIKILPTQVELEGDPNRSLMQICHDNQIPIASICKGVPSCAECRVRIVQGEYNVLPPTSPEIKLIGTSYHLDGRRLSCQVRCFGDITIDISEQIDRAKNQKRKTRGFHWAGAKNQDSIAVQDTLIFEKPKTGEATEAKDQTEGPQQNRNEQGPQKSAGSRLQRGNDSRGGGGRGRDSRPQNNQRNDQRPQGQAPKPRK